MNRKISGWWKIGLFGVLLLSTGGNVLAAEVNLTIRDAGNVVFSGAVALPTTVTSLNDNEGNPRTLDASSVLAVLGSADAASTDFSISNLTYFSSFGSLYLKCITYSGGERCDDWQYVVNGSYPFTSMDQNVLTGGENVYVYFGPQNRISLSSGNINENQILTAKAEKYDYENNSWIIRTGVVVGVTQPDPLNPFSPTEIQTSPVNASGEANFSGILAGSYNVGVKEDYYFPTKTLTVNDSGLTVPGGTAGRVLYNSTEVVGTVLGATTTAEPVIKTFDIAKAVEFIINQQTEKGSFGEDLYTDWTALALAPLNHQAQVIKLIKYLQESDLVNPSLTDYERRAMALMALGLNPYNTDGENYIGKIIESFDGIQFGNKHENNDDIFALIVLQNAGYSQEEKMIADDITFILKAQNLNGSWNESVDMTGAGIEALAAFNQNEQVKNSLIRAKEFLKQNQKNDGGWGNASSTAWAIGGILALGEKPEDWQKIDKTPADYLATIQDIDGGIKNENMQNKIWETAYVVSSLSNKTWNQIMQKFEKPKEILTQPTQAVSKPITKKSVQKKAELAKTNLATQNTATVINTLPATPAKIEKEEKGWFRRLLGYIFGAD